MKMAYWDGLPLERGNLFSSSPAAIFMADRTLSLTRRLRRSAIFAGERSNWTGDCSIRLMMVPSENDVRRGSAPPDLLLFLGAMPLDGFGGIAPEIRKSLYRRGIAAASHQAA